jgi:hypothetical protein
LVLEIDEYRALLTLINSFNLALAFFVPPAFTNIQWKTYLIFGTFCIVGAVHAFFTYPETVKKSLEEIDHIFDQKVPAWRTAELATFEERVAGVKQAGGLKEGAAEHTHEETA